MHLTGERRSNRSKLNQGIQTIKICYKQKMLSFNLHIVRGIRFKNEYQKKIEIIFNENFINSVFLKQYDAIDFTSSRNFMALP